jgi:hypothetical protein
MKSDILLAFNVMLEKLLTSTDGFSSARREFFYVRIQRLRNERLRDNRLPENSRIFAPFTGLRRRITRRAILLASHSELNDARNLSGTKTKR